MEEKQTHNNKSMAINISDFYMTCLTYLTMSMK
jgi:hypothetical protein